METKDSDINAGGSQMNIARSFTVSALRTRTLRISPLVYLRLSIGLCFFWFGALKFFPALSPAELIAEKTISALSIGLVSGNSALFMLAVVEVGLGLALILGIGLRVALFVLVGHMLCTLSPILLFPDDVFTHVPFGLTLLGQYIIKNFVILSGAWMVLHSLDKSTSAT